MAAKYRLRMKKLVEKTFRQKKRRIILHESRAKLGAICRLIQQRAAGIDDDGFARAAPDGEVGGRIAGVIKAAFAEFLRERLQFVFAAQVRLAVAAKNFIEQAGEIGDGFCHLQIRRGGENDFSPAVFCSRRNFRTVHCRAGWRDQS